METLIIVKPDWVEDSGFVNELLGSIEDHGLKIILFKKFSPSELFLREFYKKHVATFFLEELIHYMSSTPLLFLIVEGVGSVDIVRWQIIGRKGSGLRGKYQISELRNVAHASDSEETAKIELGLVTSVIS